MTTPTRAASAFPFVRPRYVVAYVVLLLAALAVFAVVNVVGSQATHPGFVAETAPTSAANVDVLPRLLGGLATVLIAGRLLGLLFRRFGQPAVIGEVMAGIVLGPSLLGRIWPAASAFLLPADIVPSLAMIAQLGVILYMFLVGLEFDLGMLKGRVQTTALVSHASMIVPFLMGTVLALYLYPRLSAPEVPFRSFALFMGIATAVTAFPVLARVLTDRGMTQTRLGATALGCAAIDDATAWCVLAFVVGVARGRVGGAMWVFLLTVAFAAFMLLVIRPLVARILGRVREEQHLTSGVVAFVFAALLLSALVTESIGIHAIFGAFLLGAIIPHDGPVARGLGRQMESIVTVLLLPAFFAVTGLRTRIDTLSGTEAWLICGLIILVATVGKFGGTLIAARLTGSDWRESVGLGVLMNTRGLMELIVLNVGLDLKIISPTLFAMMVVMALVTTLTTGPALHFVVPPKGDPRRRDWVANE